MLQTTRTMKWRERRAPFSSVSILVLFRFAPSMARMIKRWLLLVLLGSTCTGFADEPFLVTNYTATANQLISAATNSDFAFKRLAELCDTFGPRFSGSTNLEKAIDWI